MTTKPYYVYSIRSQWRGRIETPVAIGAKFVNMLDALSGIDPIFSDWLITDFPNPSSGDAATDFLNMKIVPLGAARLRIAEIIGNNVVLNDAREPSPDEGYTAIAVGGELYSPREVHPTSRPSTPTASRSRATSSLSAILKAGGEDDGGVDLEFGSKRGPPDLTTVTYRLYKAVLLAINAQQVGFTDDPQDVVAVVDHGEGADIVFGKKLDRFGHLVVGLDRDNVANHHIKRFHPALRRPVCLLARTSEERRVRLHACDGLAPSIRSRH